MGMPSRSRCSSGGGRSMTDAVPEADALEQSQPLLDRDIPEQVPEIDGEGPGADARAATVPRTVFRDRAEAGDVLAGQLGHYAGRDDVVVLALPRGGVPVAARVARALGAPLDVFVVRKLGVPGHEELAMGALASGGVRVVNQQVVGRLGLGEADLRRVAEAEGRELARRERSYREGRAPPALAGRVVILVDDGLATGSTMRAAVAAARRLG